MSAVIRQPSTGADGGDVVVEVDGTSDVVVRWAAGVDVVLGRGTSDADITYIALRQADGTQYKVYVASGTITTTTAAL